MLCFTHVMNFHTVSFLLSHFSCFLESIKILKLRVSQLRFYNFLKKNYTIITLPRFVSWFARVHCELMINPGTPIKCVCSTVVGYHNAYGCRSIQWCFIVICMVDAQYSGVFKRKKSEKLVLASDFTTYIMITCQISHGNPRLY